MDTHSFELFKSMCTSSNFTQKGKTFFRLIGDGVLQVIKCKYQRNLGGDLISVGLFSMYSSLEPQWFTASGSIQRYSIMNCFYQNDMPVVFAVPIHVQLDMLSGGVLPWLNTIDTQKKLIRAITSMDRRWNDVLKIGPYLACGEFNHAKKVAREILAQHDFARVNRLHYREEANGLLFLDRKQEEEELLRVLEMIDRGDSTEIDSYIRANYASNMTYAKLYSKTGDGSVS